MHFADHLFGGPRIGASRAFTEGEKSVRAHGAGDSLTNPEFPLRGMPKVFLQFPTGLPEDLSEEVRRVGGQAEGARSDLLQNDSYTSANNETAESQIGISLSAIAWGGRYFTGWGGRFLRVEHGDDRMRGQVHNTELVCGLRRQFAGASERGVQAFDKIAPHKFAVGQHFKDIVSPLHH